MRQKSQKIWAALIHNYLEEVVFVVGQEDEAKREQEEKRSKVVQLRMCMSRKGLRGRVPARIASQDGRDKGIGGTRERP